MKEKKSIIFLNQSSGYLMIDIINAHAPFYDELVLLTGFFNPRSTKLDPKVKIKHLKSYKRSGNFNKLYCWLIFHMQSLFYILTKYRKSKLYFVSNPPLNVFSFGIANREYAYLIYDLYPQVLVKNNLLSTSSWLYRYWIYSNKKMFRNATQVFVITDKMKKNLNYFTGYKQVKVVPIWSNSSFFSNPSIKQNIFIKDNHLDGKFIVGYSGNLGKTHPIEKIIEIAEYLKDNKEIQFLIIGDGEKKLSLQKIQEAKQLSNLKILGFQKTKIFPHVLAAINIGVVTLEANSSNLSIPSKTFDLMSAGKPILGISSNNSALAKIIKEDKIGQNFDNNSSIEDISLFILNLKKYDNLYNNYSKNSFKNGLKYTSKITRKMILN